MVGRAKLRFRWVIKLNRFRMVDKHVVIICYVVRDDIFELSCVLPFASHENRALEHLSPIPWATEAYHIVYRCMKVLLIVNLPIVGLLPLELILMSSVAP